MFPIHTSTRGAIPVETIVSPLANSSAEYAPTKCNGGLQWKRSLMNDLDAPLSTNAGTRVPFTTAVTISSMWSFTPVSRADPPAALTAGETSILSADSPGVSPIRA